MLPNILPELTQVVHNWKGQKILRPFSLHLTAACELQKWYRFWLPKKCLFNLTDNSKVFLLSWATSCSLVSIISNSKLSSPKNLQRKGNLPCFKHSYETTLMKYSSLSFIHWILLQVEMWVQCIMTIKESSSRCQNNQNLDYSCCAGLFQNLRA